MLTVSYHSKVSKSDSHGESLGIGIRYRMSRKGKVGRRIKNDIMKLNVPARGIARDLNQNSDNSRGPRSIVDVWNARNSLVTLDLKIQTVH